ncbi:MAG: class I SAM-dependent methyltransferase [Spirochaetia bacterium]|nr:class I SAM-dependent methyltransferase [Spirochaetia bacterium]
MGFYEAIAHRYDLIFPFSQAQKDFVLNSLNDPAAAALLEIGCATGSLTLGLAESCQQVTGIDIDAQMIVRARKKAALRGSTAEILRLDMLEIAHRFSAGSFDAVCSFGNTIVHLESTRQMLELLGAVRTVLRDHAPLHLQLINYDRVLDEQVTSLPTIERDMIRFERQYRYLEHEHRIEFSTILSDSETGSSSSQKVLLYPLRKQELERLLREAGFSDLSWYGGFDGSEALPTSIPLIVTAR